MKKLFKAGILIILIISMLLCLISCTSLKDQWYSSYPEPTYEYEQEIAAKSLENFYTMNLNNPNYFKVTADCTVYVFIIGEDTHSFVKIPFEYKNENNEIINDVVLCYDKGPVMLESELEDKSNPNLNGVNVILDYISNEDNLTSKKTYRESQINYLIV